MSINLDKQRENLPLSVLLSSSRTVTSMNTANFQWKKTCDDQCSKPTTKNFFKKGFPDIWIVPIKSGKTKRKSSKALSEIYWPEWLTGRYDYTIYIVYQIVKNLGVGFT